MKRRNLGIFMGSVMAVAAHLTVAGAAGPPPDAGRVMEQMKQPPTVKPRKPVEIDKAEEKTAPAAKAPAGMKVNVSKFTITGATSYDSATLQKLVVGYVGREVTFAELQQAAETITRFYRSNGYFVATAYLPAQQIEGGVVRIDVLEGKIDKVKITKDADARILNDLLASALRTSSGDPIRKEEIENRLLRLNELPGVNVKAELQPGSSVGTSDLVLNVKEKRPVSLMLDVDNFGNRFTGEYRGGATLTLNDLTGYGEQLSFRGVTAGEDMMYGKATVLVPVNRYMTKVGASFAYMNYGLGEEFKQLHSKGDSKIASVFAVHPIMLSRNLSLYAQAGYDYKEINEELLGVKNNKHLHNFSGALSLTSYDSLLSGGVTGANLSVSGGHLTLSSFDKQWDFADRYGSYGKTNLTVNRLQSLGTGSTYLYLNADGQYAFKNLDSAEKFSLGGPYGVRAFPSGEASGDEGFTANVELRQNLFFLKDMVPGDVQLTGFFDAGKSWENHFAYISNPKNEQERYGAGVGLNWGMPENFAVRASAAWATGNKPAQASDGTDRKPRVWFQVVKWF